MKSLFKILIAIIVLQSCGNKKEKVSPLKETITESVYASGIIKSINQYQVFSPVNGLIQKILVQEGDTVKINDDIFRVKSETARLNTENAQLASDYGTVNSNSGKLNEAQANINFLKTKLKNDSLLMERQRNLWAEQIGTRNELDQRELAYKNAVAAYSAAVFRYQDLKRQLSFTEAQSKNNLQISKTIAGDYTIKSQVNGRVYNIIKKEGESVTTQTAVAVIGGAGDFIIELQVDEYDIQKIFAGQKVLIKMDSYKNEVFEARVDRIIPFMNERSRSFTVEAVFITKPTALFPNLTVEANVIIQTKNDAITIPVDYLINDSLVMLSSGEKKKLVTGLKDYRKVEILRGLSTADVIIKPAP